MPLLHSRMKSAIVLFLVVSVMVSMSSMAARNASSQSILLPGTGVSIVPSQGLKLGPVGSWLVDDSGLTTITFMIGEEKRSPENDRTWHLIENNPAEHISTPSFSGNLYRHSQSNAGKIWDGWYLFISRNGQVLIVTAGYYGPPSPTVIDALRKSLMTISWSRVDPDPELALGARLYPQGLHLVTRVIGGAYYNTTGKTGDSNPSLMVTSFPFPKAKIAAALPALCEKGLGKVFLGKPFKVSGIFPMHGMRYCEATSQAPSNELIYAALVLLPNHGLLSIIGSSNPGESEKNLATFKAAVQGLEPMPRE